MRLLKLLRKKPFCNNLHHFLFVIILFLLSIKYLGFIPLLFIYLVYIFLKTKLFIYVIILFSFISIRLMIFNLEKIIEIPTNFDAYIMDIEDDSYLVFYKGIKIKIYEKNHHNLPGDIINIEFKETSLDTKSYEEEFDYKEYLYANNILHQGKGITKKYIRTTISFNRLKSIYTNYLKENLSSESYLYASSLVFGNNILEDNIKD